MFASEMVFSQSPPSWVYQFPLANYYDASTAKNGTILNLMGRIDTTGCASSNSYSTVLSSSGNLIWENTYDTTDFCNNENGFKCTVIEGNSPFYSISSFTVISATDSNYIITYDSMGNFISKFHTWSIQSFVGDMNDGYIYNANFGRPLNVAKTDISGNLVWNYLGPDSNNTQTVCFDQSTKRIIVASSDYSISLTDIMTRIIGVDTNGTEQFNVSNNFYIGQNETPKDVWYSRNHKVYGVVSSNTSGKSKGFCCDTVGNILWQTSDFNSVRDAAYDSLFNVLYILANGSGTNLKCYKINTNNGNTFDSLLIDSISSFSAKIKVDKNGYCYVGYEKALASNAIFRTERFQPNFTMDWMGQIVDTQLVSGFFQDMRINDSGHVYLIYRNSGNTIICKFVPPLINTIEENTNTNSTFALYPNPANSQFTICTNRNSNHVNNFEIQIFTICGQLYKTISFTTSQDNISISTEHFPEGMYFVERMQDGILSETEKLIIQH